MFSRIFLVGFRTTGKSTFGKILAEKLGLSFFDMDFLIKEQAGEELDSLTKKGTDWIKFRKIEQEILEDLAQTDRAIISCGGGVGVNNVIDKKTGKTFGELNREVLAKSKDSLVILLTSADEVIEKRLLRKFENKKVMPFLNQEYAEDSSRGKDVIKKQVEDSMKALQERKPLYEEIANFEIDTSHFILPRSLRNLNVVIGDPISHSLSPNMHNESYKALGIENANLFVPIRVNEKKLEKFMGAVRVLGINGISVTIPHKESVIKYLDEVDETAKKIGAVNTILNVEGKLTGYNTDWIGAITALEKKTEFKGKKVAVIGAGGAARAIVYGLVNRGAKVKIFNRTEENAKELADEFGAEFGEMGDIGEVSDYDIVINATSVGLEEDKSPLDKDLISANQIIFDVVYSATAERTAGVSHAVASPKETRLIKDAKEKGAQVIYGYEMLLYQGMEQFQMYTGYKAPIKEMENAILEGLNS